MSLCPPSCAAARGPGLLPRARSWPPLPCYSGPRCRPQVCELPQASPPSASPPCELAWPARAPSPSQAPACAPAPSLVPGCLRGIAVQAALRKCKSWASGSEPSTVPKLALPHGRASVPSPDPGASTRPSPWVPEVALAVPHLFRASGTGLTQSSRRSGHIWVTLCPPRSVSEPHRREQFTLNSSDKPHERCGLSWHRLKIARSSRDTDVARGPGAPQPSDMCEAHVSKRAGRSRGTLTGCLFHSES